MINFRDYLSYAETYLHLAEEKKQLSSDTKWSLIPSTIMAWTAIESFVNNRLDDLSSIPKDLELHEKAFLLEKRIRFNDRGSQIGEFNLEGAEYRRLEDKILFLLAKSGANTHSNIRGESLWQKFEKFKETRNAIVHPRLDKEFELNIEIVKGFIKTAKDIIQLISEHLWSKRIQF